MERITGSIVALITPFKEDGSVNYDVLAQLIDFHLENETDALLILGTTSESPTMSHEEDCEICKFTVDRVAGRIPVIASSGSNSTDTVIEKSLMLQDLGADAVLNISPYYNKANDLGMYHHFADVADAIEIPEIIYNIPGRTGINIKSSIIEELAQHDRIIGIKEASGNMSYVAEIAHLANENFAIYSGNDDMILPILSMGGSGVISVVANMLPKETHDMVMTYLNGDAAAATAEQLRLMPLIKDLFIEVNPIMIKEAMNIMGMNVGGYRRPLCNATAEHVAHLRESMRRAGIEC
ncbi:MAG: 4-hydroxy-tetrahydrodipicolinate synthase [Firmicutes bacterium]|nr:4-hydroxy-tetrahydrodipicolinate synthase [Bacillota bacterium]